MVEAGDENGTTLSQLEEGIGPETALIMHPAHLDGRTGTVPLTEVSRVARRYRIPLLVDAAYLNYPTEIMGGFLRAGADLLCFSAKYYWGPNSGGFICGRKDLIDAVAGLDFTGYESGRYLAFGRPFKLDRHIIVGTVVALQEWFEMDHEARWRGYGEKVQQMIEVLDGAGGLSVEPRYFTMDERLEAHPVNCLALETGAAASARLLWNRLAACNPSIACVAVDSKLVVAVDTLIDDQHLYVAESLRDMLREAVP